MTHRETVFPSGSTQVCRGVSDIPANTRAGRIQERPPAAQPDKSSQEVKTMAKVTAPFLSLGASGKLANTLVAFTWKGINVMRQFKIPTNPNTAAQQTQRTLFSAMVLSWRTYFTNSLMRTAWNLSALMSGNPQSGFNSAMSAMAQICSGNPDASFALSSAAGAGYIINFTMKNADDGATGDEAGNFEVWYGTDPASLLLHATPATIAAGIAATAALSATPKVIYAKLRKDSQDRSGIVKISVAA